MSKFENWQPTKSTLAWSVVGAVIATAVLGFTAGGWVTGATANKMAADAANDAAATVVAEVCLENFKTSANARADLEQISGLSGMRQRQFVEKAEWATMPNGAADTLTCFFFHWISP